MNEETQQPQEEKPKYLDPAALEAEVRKLAAEYPDAVYPKGMYSYTKGAAGSGVGCIMGQAAKRLGATEEVLEKWNRGSMCGDPQQIAAILGNSWGYDWLRLTQERQDSQDSWSEAVRYADEATS